MNSYPPQFLAHPQPLMFVAGLTPSRDRSGSTAQPGSSRRPSDASRPPASGSGSGSGSTYLDPSQSTALNSITPLTSPSARQRELPKSPPPLTSPGSEAIPTAPTISKEEEKDEKDRDFDKLVSDLKGALEAKSGSGKVWIPEGERKDFRIMLVDKSIRLPARKVPPPTTNPDQPAPSHSPLSPLTISSPTYPDGLITPMWVRKHSEFTPSVFVLFLRLWECPDPNSLSTEALQEKEKEMDDSLVKEIADRRRRLGERGIKLTVVLMASAAALDSPVLDPRLSYLRRASSLSAKASLFVLTPVPADQLPDFVQSLQDALYDSAMEYYAAHGKKVRRKRVRLPSVSSGAMLGIPGKTLGSQGWAVRYDWKAGWFAELRGEMVEARRHYEDCWNELAKMFGSTQTLPPRTKRWAEAKVLADCVAIRICRLLLYSSEAPKVLTPFHVHLKRFGDLSRGWGIGEETFEYWSSLSRQYRIFAELLEMAQADNLRIPYPSPPSLPTAPPVGVTPSLEFFATPVSSGNPLQVLQQPAYYYYAAADCTLQRKVRFDEALAVEEDAKESEAGGHISMAPGFANEKKVDHSELAIELYTKAYQLLKEKSLGHTRVALLVAFRIAETYCASSQYDLAMRFFDRISPSFQQDRWSPIVRQIWGLWYKCAQNSGNVETAAKLLLEMMSPKSGVEGEDRVGLQDDFLSLLKTTQPSSSDPIVVQMDLDSAILNTTTAFWTSEAELGGQIPFQVTLECHENVYISDLDFSSIQISFSDDRPSYTLHSGDGKVASMINLGLIHEEEVNSATGALKWSPGQRVVINGMIKSDLEGEVKIENIELNLKHDKWTFQLYLPLEEQACWYTAKGAVTPVNELASVVNFIPRPLAVKLDIAECLGYVGEQVPVVIKIKNDDDREVYLRLSVFLPPNDDEQDLTAKYEDQESTSLLQDIILGPLEPSSSIEKTVYITSLSPGSKMIDISLQASLGDDESERVEEVNHTLTLDVEDPFELSTQVMFRHASESSGDGVEGWGTVMSLLSLPGKKGVTVDSIEIEAKNDSVMLLTSSLAKQGESFPQDWNEGTVYSLATKFALVPSRRPSTTILGPSTDPSAYIVIKWRSNKSSSFTTTHLPIPPLLLPPQDSFITAHLTPSPTARLNYSTTISLSISNAHPSATATQLAITLDPSSNFIWQGPKSVHVPPLAPGQGWSIGLEVVPTGSTGTVELPKVRLWEGEGDEREELDVVILGRGGERVEIGGASILVLP